MSRLWITAYRCERCRSDYAHVEVSPVADEAHGLSVLARWCECGGFLRVVGQGKGPSDSAA
jgi:hypothetical protein